MARRPVYDGAMRIWLFIAAVNGALAVLAGAFAAHGLKAQLPADMLAVFETGARYQMYHALIACGSQMILFATGRGSVVGSALAPVIKVCANPQTYRRMSEDMDVDAGRILEARGTLDEVGAEIFELMLAVADGQETKSEELGHQEFILTYKSFTPIGPSCLPNAA